MLCIVIKDCPDKQAAMKAVHNALIGVSGYDNNEIILTDEPKGTDRFMILIGNSTNSSTDLTYEVSYHDFIPVKTE